MPQLVSDIVDRMRPGLAGRYRIERELGRGGMAIVYLAHDLKHGREVAIKVLRPELAAAAEPERFLREIRTAARLTHPHILPLYDSGETAGLLYFVMPVVGCETLRERLAREGALPLGDALRFARELAAALDYAHRQGVVHRDVKPENILLHEGRPVLADFGVARGLGARAEPAVSLPGTTVGTPAYMSPEQAVADGELDGRSDQYALACVTWEMLAGRPPFTGNGARNVMAQHAVAPVPPLRAQRPEVPAAVEAALRRALAKAPDERFETMAGFAQALDTADTVTLAVPTAERLRSIAVLPFANATGDASLDYLGDGLTEELIDALAHVAGLWVASRGTSFALKGQAEDVRAVGARLGVAAVLEGSVRAAGGRLRILVQLSETATGRLLWSQRFERGAEDVFALQDEIAQAAVRALRATLLAEAGIDDVGEVVPHRYTGNARAYTHYLKGRFAWNRRTHEGLLEGVAWFERAIAEDPSYALAYTGLADSYALQVDYRGVPVREGMERARAMARHAIALDESLAEAHTSLGWVQFIYDWDWEAAERSFRRALELNPRYATAHQWYAWIFVARGRFHEAVVEGRTSVELDPASVSLRRTLGWLLLYAGDAEGAVTCLRRAVAMNPTAEETLRILGFALARLGQIDEAEAALRDAAAASSEDAYALGALAWVLAGAGRREEARALRDALVARAATRYVSPVPLAMAHVGLGDADAAFAELERAYQERRGWMVYLRVEPILDPLRADPRFADLLARMRLG